MHTQSQVDVTNSFAVPFEEDRDDPTIWFLDQTFLVEMARMFERINGAYSLTHQYLPRQPALIKFASEPSINSEGTNRGLLQHRPGNPPS